MKSNKQEISKLIEDAIDKGAQAPRRYIAQLPGCQSRYWKALDLAKSQARK